eukprot:g8968.t1
MESDEFTEVLETLDDIKTVATNFQTVNTHELDGVNQERLLHDVIKLRRLVIWTTKCTESERTRLISAATQEGLTARSLCTLHSRIDVLNERINEARTSVEDQDHRVKLEEANEQLMAAKKRMGLKREIYNAREKALSTFRSELTPVLKLGTTNSVSEFDDEDRVNSAFCSLPRPLQYLYGQLRNVKKIGGKLPIEISIISKTKPSSSLENSSLSEFASVSIKKTKSSEKKAKHGPGEKRRKRWYESIMGKDSGGTSHDDWMPHQRSRNAYLLIPTTNSKLPNEIHVKKYQLLMKLVENSEKQPSTHKKKAKSKKTKKRSHGQALTGENSASSLFSLPVPEGPLCVELKFLDGDREIAGLIFSWYLEQVFVSSFPDWLLVKTLKSQISPLPVSSRSLVGSYGYPLDWAQELCGVELIKDEVMDLDQVKTINEEMIRQQEQLSKFIIHARNQALDLNAFRSGLSTLKTKMIEGSKKDSDKTKIVSIVQVPIEKLKINSKPFTVSQEPVTKHRHFATGWWTVVMRKLSEEDKTSQEQSDSLMNQSTGVSYVPPLVRIRFFPHNTSHEVAAKKTGVEKGELYYQWEGSNWTPSITLEASDKLKELNNDSLAFLTGPITSEELVKIQEKGLTDELIHGKMIVQKRPRIPKRFHGLLPMNYEKRFFPFHLQTRKTPTTIATVIEESQKHLYRIYRIIIQRGHIQLSVLYQVNLLTPLMPTLTIEGVYASSEFSKKSTGETGKDSKDRSSGIDGKRSTDHVKLEREKILKQEGEALKIRDQFDLIADQLETLPNEASKKSRKQTPHFQCNEAKSWITTKLSQMDRFSPEDCVKRLEELLKEWCEDHASVVKSLNEFFDSGGKGKKKDNPRKRTPKPPKENRREKRTSGEGKTSTHDDELEQGEIPSVSVKHSSNRRRDTPRSRDRQRSPVRNRSSQANDGRESSDRNRRLSSPRLIVQGSRSGTRVGVMRMDIEHPGERRSHSASRPRRL